MSEKKISIISKEGSFEERIQDSIVKLYKEFGDSEDVIYTLAKNLLVRDMMLDILGISLKDREELFFKVDEMVSKQG